mmetsp:Transcript_63941/g.88355  ORF Transcript_63941/g.88355 Transcript_63941/m.88355 type:complete len:278 (-) Transcript_63941:1402-2235(-)
MKELVVFGRNDATADQYNVFTSLFIQSFSKCWDKSLVTGSKTACTDNMHIIIDCLTSNLLRGLEKTTNIDIETEVSESTSDNFSSSIMTVLTHLSDKNSRVSTFLLGEVLNVIKSSLVFMSSLVTSLLHRLFTVSSSNNLILSNMSTIYFLQSRTNFTDSGSSLGSLNRESQKVALVRFSSFSQRFKASLDLGFISILSNLVDSLNLFCSDLIIINLQNIIVLFFLLKSVLVNTNDNLSSRINLCLSSSSAFLNSKLRHTRYDSLGHATEIFNFFDD